MRGEHRTLLTNALGAARVWAAANWGAVAICIAVTNQACKDWVRSRVFDRSPALARVRQVSCPLLPQGGNLRLPRLEKEQQAREKYPPAPRAAMLLSRTTPAGGGGAAVGRLLLAVALLAAAAPPGALVAAAPGRALSQARVAPVKKVDWRITVDMAGEVVCGGSFESGERQGRGPTRSLQPGLGGIDRAQAGVPVLPVPESPPVCCPPVHLRARPTCAPSL